MTPGRILDTLNGQTLLCIKMIRSGDLVTKRFVGFGTFEGSVVDEEKKGIWRVLWSDGITTTEKEERLLQCKKSKVAINLFLTLLFLYRFFFKRMSKF